MTKIVQSAKSRRQKIFGSKITSKKTDIDSQSLDSQNLVQKNPQTLLSNQGFSKNTDQSLTQLSDKVNSVQAGLIADTQTASTQTAYNHSPNNHSPNNNVYNKAQDSSGQSLNKNIARSVMGEVQAQKVKPKAAFVEKIGTNGKAKVYNNIFDEDSGFFAKEVFNRDFAEGKKTGSQSNTSSKKPGWLSKIIQKIIRKPYKPKTSIQAFGRVKKSFKNNIKMPLENGIYFKNSSGESKFISVEKLVLLDFLK